MKIDFTHVIEIHVEDQIIVDRMSGRRVHPSSGRNYHIDFNPPDKEGFDNETGDPLIQREDDKPETVLKRLDVYHKQTRPLTDFYKNLSNQGVLKFFIIDVSQSVEKVYEQISNQI